MLVLRWLILVPLIASVVCFLLFAVTGQAQYKRVGLVVLKWTLAAAFVFFAVLIFDRLRSGP
jgi:NADH:ubiquinone oxidoreductase subunit 4 (subunit M)